MTGLIAWSVGHGTTFAGSTWSNVQRDRPLARINKERNPIT